MKYKFEDYFSEDDLKHGYEAAKESIRAEVENRLGIDVSKLSEHYFIDYWKKKCNTKWLNDGDWKFLWDQSGRERIDFSGIDKETFLKCCIAHLQGCMVNTYDNCDLIEHNNPKSYVNLCYTCLKPLIGTESERYCARCYRDVLNKWRP